MVCGKLKGMRGYGSHLQRCFSKNPAEHMGKIYTIEIEESEYVDLLYSFTHRHAKNNATLLNEIY